MDSPNIYGFSWASWPNSWSKLGKLALSQIDITHSTDFLTIELNFMGNSSLEFFEKCSSNFAKKFSNVTIFTLKFYVFFSSQVLSPLFHIITIRQFLKVLNIFTNWHFGIGWGIRLYCNGSTVYLLHLQDTKREWDGSPLAVIRVGITLMRLDTLGEL